MLPSLHFTSLVYYAISAVLDKYFHKNKRFLELLIGGVNLKFLTPWINYLSAGDSFPQTFLPVAVRVPTQ